MRIEEISQEWTAEERVKVIAYISAYSRYMSMQNIKGNHPNMETIMCVAFSPCEQLETQRKDFDFLFGQIRGLGIKPKTIDQCKEEFAQLRAAYFARQAGGRR